METETPAPIDVLYEDEHAVVVSKPPGLLVHRTKESVDRVFLLQSLGRQLGRFLFPIHRLDRPVSGTIIFAFTSEAARALSANLASPDARKEYLALARGSTPESGVLDRQLRGKSGARQPCFTEFARLAEMSRCSLLRVRISTGRRHQIRRHFSHFRHQLIGDTSYGKGKINEFFRENYGLPRLFLHAHRLSVRHPARDERIEVTAPLAADLREFLLRLPDCDTRLVASL